MHKNNVVPNSYEMAALNLSRNALLYCGLGLHSQAYPLENSSVLWLRLRLRPLTGNVSGGEIPNQKAINILIFVTGHCMFLEANMGQLI